MRKTAKAAVLCAATELRPNGAHATSAQKGAAFVLSVAETVMGEHRPTVIGDCSPHCVADRIFVAHCQKGCSGAAHQRRCVR